MQQVLGRDADPRVDDREHYGVSVSRAGKEGDAAAPIGVE